MTVLTWDNVGEHLYETGVDRGVLYIPDAAGAYLNGYAWNGLTTVTEKPSGADATPQYADNIKYLNLLSLETFGGTIEAFTYPDEFNQCDGTVILTPGVYAGQQARKAFGMSYRTRLGNELDPLKGYKLHLVYGAVAAPSEKAYASINDSPAAINFSWEFWTTPVPVTGQQPTSYMCIDSTKVLPAKLAELEAFLYGTVGTNPSLPTPDAVAAIFSGSLTSVTPGTPTYNSTTDLVTIPGTTGVIYRLNGVVRAAGTWAITADAVVTATPALGYKFPPAAANVWFFTFV